MGSGGTNCDVCRKLNRDCECLPDSVKHSCPCCPWCGEEHVKFAGNSTTCVNCGRQFKWVIQTYYRSTPVAGPPKEE